ncbi:hypothetical protein F4703DRAFT_1978691 [Phycomyces blakesleeanus]
MSDLISQLLENHSLQRNATIIPHRINSRTSTQTSPHHSKKLPTYPSYLKNTVYAALVKEQYEHQKIKRDRTKTSGIISTFRFKESDDNPLDDMCLALPSSWNQLDKSFNIQIRKNSLDLFYTGPGENDRDAASVRSNYAIPPQCGVYYYEAKILSKGENGFIGIGFSSSGNDLDRLPGWDENSWGYHGDDGFCFSGSGSGVAYGPYFTTGDVIGCCMDFSNNTIFYTKNGTLLNTAFKDVKPAFKLYPNIGLRTPGEHVLTNFGEEPFVFDIDRYVADQKLKIWKEVTSEPHRMQAPNITSPKYKIIADPNSNETQDNQNGHKQIMEQLIIPYLMHQGYTQTAKSVIKSTEDVMRTSSASIHALPYDISNDGEVTSLYSDEIKKMEERHVIKAAVLDGNIDLAIRIIQQLFPNMIKDESQSSIVFELKCQKFIEMMKSANQTEEPLSHLLVSHKNEDSHMDEIDSKASLLKDYVCEDMEIDEDFEDRTHVPSKRANSGIIIDKAIGQGSGIESGSQAKSLSKIPCLEDLIQDIMRYGEKLQDEYRYTMTSEQRAKLTKTFALLAYNDPIESPLAYIMDKSNRDVLASKLNTALCVCQQQRATTSLESIYKQAILTNKELVWSGNAKSSLININQYLKSEY